MKNGLTKENSKLIYGIAIIMMVYHHLFWAPGCIQGEYTTIISYSIIQKIAWYCRMCIPLFAFISGYGICCKVEAGKLNSLKKQYILAVSQILKLLKKYWLVYIIFIPIGLLLGKITIKPFSEMLLSILGLKNTYNTEWWYIAQQMMMLLLFPLFATLILAFDKLISKLNKKIIITSIIVVFILLALFRNLSIFSFFINSLDNGRFVFTLVFFEGYLVKHYHLFEIGKDKKWFQKAKYFLALLFLISLSAIRIYRAYDACYCKYDAFISVPIIWSIITLFELPILRVFAKGIMFIGGFSTYMWLTHTFFSNYYWGVEFAKLNSSILIFAAILISSLVTAFLLQKIEGIPKLISRNKKIKNSTNDNTEKSAA